MKVYKRNTPNIVTHYLTTTKSVQTHTITPKQMNFYCLLLIVIFTISCFDCSPSYNQYNYMTKKGKYCGKHLTDMLFLVCGGNFYNPRNQRSTNNHLNFDNYYSNEISSDHDFDSMFPFLRQDLFSIMPKKASKPIGVVDECCRNSCSIETMRTYCGEE